MHIASPHGLKQRHYGQATRTTYAWGSAALASALDSRRSCLGNSRKRCQITLLSGSASAKLKLRGGQTSISNPIEKTQGLVPKGPGVTRQASAKHQPSTRQAGAKLPRSPVNNGFPSAMAADLFLGALWLLLFGILSGYKCRAPNDAISWATPSRCIESRLARHSLKCCYVVNALQIRMLYS